MTDSVLCAKKEEVRCVFDPGNFLPRNLKLSEMKSVSRRVEGMEDLYELQVWSASCEDLALSYHVMIKDLNIHSAQNILNQLQSQLKEKFRIEHTTIQFECGWCATQRAECIFMGSRR